MHAKEAHAENTKQKKPFIPKVKILTRSKRCQIVARNLRKLKDIHLARAFQHDKRVQRQPHVRKREKITMYRRSTVESIQGRSQPDTGANHEQITTGSTTETEREPGDETKTIKIKQEVQRCELPVLF